MDEAMEGGRFARPIRRGSVVERARSSRNVHALLRHFERVGFTLAPRLLEAAGDGTREVLSFIEGRAAHYPLPAPQRTDAVLVNVARAVRALHDAPRGSGPPIRTAGGTARSRAPSTSTASDTTTSPPGTSSSPALG